MVARFVILILLFGLCSGRRRNPCWNVKPGLRWWSIPCEYGINKADPIARVFNGRLFIYTTWDHTTGCGRAYNKPEWKRQGFQEFCMPGYRAYSSGDKNLRRNWYSHGVMLLEKDVPWIYRGDRGYLSAARMWALDVVQGNDRKYYMFFPAPIRRNEMVIGVAVSTRPGGPFRPRRRPIPGKHGIDPSVVKLPNGRWAVFTSGNGNIYVQYINNRFTWATRRVLLENLEDGYKEGPAAEVRAGKLFLYYSLSKEGEGYHIRQAGAKVSNRPEWGFWDAGVAVGMFDGRTNHGTVKTFKGRHWAFFHRHTERNGARWAARKTVITPAKFTKWGSMVPIWPYWVRGRLVINPNRPPPQ